MTSELIISDNASEDRAAAICKGYEERDKRIHYHRFETNQGAARNFTAVFEMARGEYFKWAAYDDHLPAAVSGALRGRDGQRVPVGSRGCAQDRDRG